VGVVHLEGAKEPGPDGPISAWHLGLFRNYSGEVAKFPSDGLGVASIKVNEQL
jgi:hypothetical protein